MNKLQRGFFSLVILLLPLFAQATELQPWFGPDKLIELRAAYLYRHYAHLDISGNDIPYTSNDHFLDVGLSVSPMPAWSFEFEGIGAGTHQRTFGLDNFRFTGRYLILDDVPGTSPISLVAGVTISRATRLAQNDLSSFHHGRSEYQFHLAAGKEFSCSGFWTSRIWGVAIYGITPHGSPWWHAIAAFDRNFWNCHQFGIFADGLFGLGDNPLDPVFFTDYGNIRHRSIDLGAKYTYLLNPIGNFTLEYAYRVWARNFPSRANTIVAKITIPFGL